VSAHELPIGDSTDLFRLVPPLDVDWDENDGTWIVKSSAFQNTSGTNQMSVVLGDRLAELGRPPEDARHSMPERFVVALTAGEVRGEEQEVERAATPIEPAHGNVVGDKGKTRRRRFAALARWIVDPPPP
jgi:hypothetical protein